MKTGVGILYNGTLDRLLQEHADAVDFVSVIPERFWTDHGRDAATRFAPLPEELERLERLARDHQLVAHGIGLSIASGSTFDVEHIRELARWRAKFQFGWVSEHLAAVRVRTEVTSDHHAGLTLPLAWDEELLDMLCERIAIAQDTLGCQLLLENGVVHTPVPETDMSEIEFLNALFERSGCGMLLDLHNLYVNHANQQVDGAAFLDALNMDAVGEVHVAGGNKLYGVYLDSHSGKCPQQVWQWLAKVVPRCGNLRGVTFEFHESYFPQMGDEGVLRELQLARDALKSEGGPTPWQLPSSNVHSQT
jgi:uncharacterized protein (UPF0276 family)